ncbi:MAG: tetratricopeptide repeat protein [Myxococcota bacterium]
MNRGLLVIAAVFLLIAAVFLLIAAVLLVAPALGHADASEARTRSEYWRSITEPGHRRAHALQSQAFRQFRLATGVTGPMRRAHLENALDRLNVAIELSPDDPDILYLFARVTAAWERVDRSGQVQRRNEEAIQIYRRLRGLDPEFRSFEVANDLGILYTRVLDYDAAQREYAHAVSQALRPFGLGILYLNYAEVTMLGGNLEGAVRRYQRSIEIAEDPRTRVLALFGQAVALDRLGEHRQALESTRQALLEADGSDDALRADGVFFEPGYELYWYEALVHESRAASEPEERDHHLGEARRSWMRYLVEARGSGAPWVGIAEEHLVRLDQQVAPSEAPGPRRPRWLPGSPFDGI